MYAFISSAYLLIFPLLFLLVLLAQSKYRAILIQLRSSVQLSLIVYALYLVRQMIGLFQLRKLLKMPNANIDYFGTGLFEMGCMIVLPFLFLQQRILNSWKLGFVIWLILMHMLLRQDWMIIINGWSIVNAILFYISLVTTIYALLWLLKNQSFSSAQ